MGTPALEIRYMMRKVIAAALALSPMMLHAQATSPAQTQAADNAPVLQSKLIQPKEIVGAGRTAATSTAAPLRISSGVAAPKLIHTVNIVSDNEWPWKPAGVDRKVVVGMIVDQTGTPSDLKIVKSAGPEMDKNVLAAVSQYRFKPGTLDHQPTSVPVNLEIVLRNVLR